MTNDPALPGPATSAPVCPRHPDRVSYVRCQRCGRPTCPDCQRPAAVGIQCVDCVHAAASQQRATKTIFGGTVRGGRPVVTLTLIAICVVSWLIQLASDTWTEDLAFVPVYGKSEPWRFLTSAFLHDPNQITHILFNMIALWAVGPYLEQAFGRSRFVALYLLSALGGSVGVLLLADPASPAWRTYEFGASGAVFGLFGAILFVLRRLGNSARGIVIIIAINVVIGFVVPGIAWQAHVGGLVVGLALGAVFTYAPREHSDAIAIGATVAVLVILVGLSALKYASVPAFMVASALGGPGVPVPVPF